MQPVLPPPLSEAGIRAECRMEEASGVLARGGAVSEADAGEIRGCQLTC